MLPMLIIFSFALFHHHHSAFVQFTYSLSYIVLLLGLLCQRDNPLNIRDDVIFDITLLLIKLKIRQNFKVHKQLKIDKISTKNSICFHSYNILEIFFFFLISNYYYIIHWFKRISQVTRILWPLNKTKLWEQENYIHPRANLYYPLLGTKHKNCKNKKLGRGNFFFILAF